jgi:hypothetical protein
MEEDNAPFRWDLRQGRLRLHTPAGGVVEGTRMGDVIEIDLPGSGVIRFRRTSP